MAVSKDNQVKQKKSADKKATEKKTRRSPNPNQKRGQPTAAARLISSAYIKFGWHKPLSGEVKEAIQGIRSIADSMYMLQMERTRPIEPLSMRNGLFWEHRQLVRQSVLSTPAVDHLDLFPNDEDLFQETLSKLRMQLCENEKLYRLHCLFDTIRSREFLLLPVQIDDNWITIITRIQRKGEVDLNQPLDNYTDMEITDIALIDPVPEGRESRERLIIGRLALVFREGCIDLAENLAHRNLAVADIDTTVTPDYRWQTGLIAYAISREFIRRIKVLQYRQDRGECSSSDDQEFLWAPFEEHYNFDFYRQCLMAACAYQAIEGSAYQARMALEVPSEDSNYHSELLGHGAGKTDYLAPDEKFDVFQSETHTHAIDIQSNLIQPSPRSPTHEVPLLTPSRPICRSPEFIPDYTSPSSYSSEQQPALSGSGPTSSTFPNEQEPLRSPSKSMSDSEEAETRTEVAPHEDQVHDAGEDVQENAPVAPMGVFELSPIIPGLDIANSVKVTNAPELVAEDQSALSHRSPAYIASSPQYSPVEETDGVIASDASFATIPATQDGSFVTEQLATVALNGVESNIHEDIVRKRSLSDCDFDEEVPLLKKVKIEDES
ncbi:hypothetical protein F5Y12DRAFT_786564 [Xylaria sp. FL1777]|nr:hypothetical protein F5Y12DRAFT_786564 [Xylaria sp. FL1777]